MNKRKPRNAFEKSGWNFLRRVKAKFSYESERIPYVIAGHYIPDYIILTTTGKLYVEYKGYLRAADKRKLVAVKRQHPELDIRIVFYATNKSYIRWAEKHGFRWAVGKIPIDWLNGL